MKPFDLSGIKRFFAVAVCLATAIFLFFQPVAACSSDYDIWQVRSKNADPLYRFIKNGKAGYIDRTGKIVVAPTLNYYGNSGDQFSDGLLLTYINRKYVYINRTGKIVLEPKFDRVWDFSDGLAAVLIEDDGKWGYMDKTGKLVISPRFEGFPNGYVSPFSDGLAMIEVKDKFGYIDRTGEFVIPPRFLEGSDFSEGFARVVLEGPCLHVGDGGCAVFNGETVGGEMPADQTAPMCKFAFIDKTGAFLTNERYVRTKDFSEGLAAVILKGEWNPLGFGSEGNWGFIDTKGNVVIKPQFDNVRSFSDGLAAVRIGGKWGFINKQGEMVVKPQFDLVEDFADGLAPVGTRRENDRKEEHYYIDKEGKRAFPETFFYASHFFKGLAHVKLKTEESMKGKSNYTFKGTFAYIDTKGKKVFVYERDDNLITGLSFIARVDAL